MSSAGARPSDKSSDRLPDICWQRRLGAAVTFASHGETPGFPINILQREGHHLTCSQPEAEQRHLRGILGGERRAAYGGAGLLVVTVLLVGLNVGGWRARLLGRAPSARIGSLAVLPLENLSRNPEQEYFADGMTEALITNLAQISTLKVISRTSAMQFKG